jgi:hypothetical protein
MLTLLLERLLVSRLVARRPEICTATVAATVRTPTPAAMIAAMT